MGKKKNSLSGPYELWEGREEHVSPTFYSLFPPIVCFLFLLFFVISNLPESMIRQCRPNPHFKVVHTGLHFSICSLASADNDLHLQSSIINNNMVDRCNTPD